MEWLISYTFCLQTARPILYDAQEVNQMIQDIEKIDLASISSHALYSTKDASGDQVSIYNDECR